MMTCARACWHGHSSGHFPHSSLVCDISCCPVASMLRRVMEMAAARRQNVGLSAKQALKQVALRWALALHTPFLCLHAACMPARPPV